MKERPINHFQLQQEPQEKVYSLPRSHKLKKLDELLKKNREAQYTLLKYRNSINRQIHQLTEYISTYKLRSEYPPALELISFIKFDRHINNTLSEQFKCIEQQEALKKTNEDEKLFLQKLEKNRKKYLEEEEKHIIKSDDPKKINFTKDANHLGYKNGIQYYRAWYEEYKKRTCKNLFNNQEERLIVSKQKKYGDNWEKICQFIDNKTFEEVYYQFQNRINPKQIQGRWTFRQSLSLIFLCEHFGLKKWALISQKMQIKSQLQVRERYCNIMDPNIGRNNWMKEQERLLLKIAPELNYSWKDIAKIQQFEGKTDNAIWRKYRNLMVTKDQHQIRQLMPGGETKNLIKKILQMKKTLIEKKNKQRQKNIVILASKASSTMAKYEVKDSKKDIQNVESVQIEEKIEERILSDQEELSYIKYDK